MKVAAAVLLCFLFIPVSSQDSASHLPDGPAPNPAFSAPAEPEVNPAYAISAGPVQALSNTAPAEPDRNPDDTVVVIGTGDIMLGTDYPSRTYLPPGGDCSPLLGPVLDVLRSGDVLFGNLEGVFCSEGGTPKYCKDTTNCFVFRMPDHFVNCLVEAGYDVVSVANNHVNDFGPHGRTTTAGVLTEAGIAFAGFTTHPWTVFQKGGVTYGFAAFAPHTGTMDLKDYGEAARITRMLDSIADIVIISFHGGAEGREHQHVVRGDEEYLGYNRGNTYLFAHTVVDAGADVVFGHGPHVTRAMEVYRDRLICYSLGNFCTYRRFNLSGPNGLAPIVKVRMDRLGNFISAEVIPVYQPGEGGPRIDPAKRVIRSLQELTAADFPDRLLSISADGTVLPPFGLARLEVLGGGSAEGVQGEDAWGWAPERLEMIWTHFLGETVPDGEPGSCRRNRVERTGTPMLVKEGRDIFLIQDFDHQMKKLDASTGALVWEYAAADRGGTRAVSYISGRELPGDLVAETGPGIMKIRTGEPALLYPRPAAGGLTGDRPEEWNPALKEVLSRQAGTPGCVPLITEKRMVVCNEDGIWLYAYDRNFNVELLDRLPVPVNSAPVIHGGKLYVASLNGYLYCLGDKD